jgi:transposase
MIRLTNEQWERIRNHFPEEHIADGRPGRKRIPIRRVFEAVLRMLNTGAQWHMLPQSYPNYKSVHRRFQSWCRDEVLRRVLMDVANELRDKGALDEAECFIDATFVMAKGGGAERARSWNSARRACRRRRWATGAESSSWSRAVWRPTARGLVERLIPPPVRRIDALFPHCMDEALVLRAPIGAIAGPAVPGGPEPLAIARRGRDLLPRCFRIDASFHFDSPEAWVFVAPPPVGDLLLRPKDLLVEAIAGCDGHHNMTIF